MKKILSILAIILLTAGSTFAAEADKYCAQKPYNLSGGFSGFLAGATGTNFLATQIVEHEIAKALKKELGGNFKVKVKTFGGRNLLDGKFNSLTATSKSINSNGMYISDVQAKTICEFNHVKYENDQLYFVENMLIKYEGKVTEADLKRIMLSPEYTKAVKRLKITTNGASVARIMNPALSIENNRIRMSYDLVVPFLFGDMPKHMSFLTNLDVENGKIKFAGIDFGSPVVNAAMQSALPVINKLNPLIYNVSADKNTNAVMSLKNIKIVNNEILADGVLVIPKNYRGH